LSEEEIDEYVEHLRRISGLVDVVVAKPVVVTDADDNPVVYTAVDGRTECAAWIATCFSQAWVPSAGQTTSPC
jgi:hypothetical protein